MKSAAILTSSRASTLGSSGLPPLLRTLLLLVAPVLGCGSDRAIESSISPKPTSRALTMSRSGDKSWTRLDVDAIVTVQLGTAAGRPATGSRVTQMHAERGQGTDGRWYTRYTFAQPSVLGGGDYSASQIDPAEFYQSDDRREFYLVTRDGRRLTPPSNGTTYAGIDPSSSMPTQMRRAHDAAADRLSMTPAAARASHWLDDVIVTKSRRQEVLSQLQAAAGPPVLDSRGHAVYKKTVGNRSTRIVVDPESEDLEEFELSAGGQKMFTARVSHAVQNGVMTRSQIEYELLRHDSSFVTKIALYNHRMTGGGL
jgi:hypothetical protein